MEAPRTAPASALPSSAVPSSAAFAHDPAWQAIKAAVSRLQPLQVADGSIPREDDRARARQLTDTIRRSLFLFRSILPDDANYLDAASRDFARWQRDGFGVPDFLDSLRAFQPQQQRQNGRVHLVIFPMYTQNGSTNRFVEAVLVEVIWPDFVATLEAEDYSNALFVPIRFVDFTAGYDSNSAVLFPETISLRQVESFSWGAIFADREAARFRRVVLAAAEVTRLQLPADAAALLKNQVLAEETFVLWDLIHDRTHMRGDLPFDPFMIKQRMPYFLYSLEELRCDLTAYREAVRLTADPRTDAITSERARLVQYAVIFDRIFRFALTGNRVRNYDGLGGQLLFAWLHQHHVLHWTDSRLSIDWPAVPDAVLALASAIDELYWRSIDRPKVAHWLAAYDLVAATLEPHPASRWATRDLPFTEPIRALTDAVLDDEFPLSMFYEALAKKLAAVIVSTSGITGRPASPPPAPPRESPPMPRRRAASEQNALVP